MVSLHEQGVHLNPHNNPPSMPRFFKQKTAYEMESRDWSSDVCSSD
eukprot:COSAG03_NODE_19794_length_330_cov_0.173160_2_plen_45_part_01